MANRTAHASWNTFVSVVDQMIDVEVKSKGLAGLFHEAVCQLIEENDGFDVTTSAKAFAEVESRLKEEFKKKIIEKFGEGTALSTAVPTFRQRTSEYRSGIAKGLDPTKHKSNYEYRKALHSFGKDDSAPNKPKNDGVTPSTSSGEGGGPAVGKLSELQVIENKLSDEVRQRLNKVLANLATLDSNEALKITIDLDTAVNRALAKLKKAGGGRFAGAGIK